MSPQESVQKVVEAERAEKNKTPREFLSSLSSTPRPRIQRSVPTFDAQEEEQESKPMSLGGFGENVLRNVWDIAKGFVNVFPTAVKGAVDVFGDPAGLMLLMQEPQHLVQAFRQTGEHLKDAIIAPYQKHGLRVLYEEPITPILDAMTILSLGGTSIAKAGRMAGNQRIFETGRRIAKIPESIGRKLVDVPLKAAGINPETRTTFLRFRRQEQAGARLEAGLRKERILAGTEKLADADMAALERLVLDGGTKAELAANPRIAAVRNALQEWLTKEREFELGQKGRAFLTDEQMKARVVKEYAERNGLDVASAKAKYDALEVKPLYAPAIRESAGGLDWVNAFMEPSVIKKGKTGFLEHFKSAKGAAEIRTRIARAIDDFYVSRANLRLIDRIIQQPGYTKAVGKGEATLDDLLPTQGVYQRYFKDKSRAGSLYTEELTQKLMAGGMKPEAAKAEMARLMRSDLATQQAAAKAVNITIPDRTLQKLIAREFRVAGGDWGAFLRVYDRITDLFRTSATKLSPGWYTGNIVGDALLSSLAGSNWPLAKKLIEANPLTGRSYLPRTLQSGPVSLAEQTANIPLVGERVNRFVGSLADGVGQIDDAARAGVFSQAVAKELRSTMMRFASSEEMLRLAREVSLAPDQLADLIVRNQQLGEQIARQSGAIMKIDGQIAKKRKELNEALGQEAKTQARLLQELENRKQTILASKAELEAEATARGQIPRPEELAPGYAQTVARERATSLEGKLESQRQSTARQLSDKERAEIVRTGEILKRDMQKRIDELSAQVERNAAVGAGLRANQAKLVDLKTNIKELQSELQWQQGLHPSKARDHQRIAQLRDEIRSNTKEAVALERTIEKQTAARTANAPIKKALDKERVSLAGRQAALDEVVSGRARSVDLQAKYDALVKAGFEEEGKLLLSEYRTALDELSRGAKPKIPARSERHVAVKMDAEQLNAELRVIESKRLAALENQVGPQRVQRELDTLMEVRDSYKADLTEKAMAREIERIPELARKAEIAEQAMDRANTFLGEYLGLGPIERGVFRRLVPFYPWMKAMSKLAFTFPFIAPGKAFFWHRYAAAMTEMMGDPELPDWLAAYTPAFVRANGDTVWARFTALSPFGSLRTEKIGDIPIPSILAFWRSNPWISTGYKLIGGKDQWNAGSVPYGEDLVAVNDGEVYRFNEQGKLEKVIAQPPAIRTLAHSFPVVQMIDQLISNYDVRKGKPVLNPDGTVKYPVELHQRLAQAAGVKLLQRSREQVMATERSQAKHALDELRSQYKRADPERRKYIEGIFEDYSRGDYRKFAAN